MILRNAAVRHGRALTPPISRSALRLLSTDAHSQNMVNPSSNASVQAWPTGQSSPAQPKILSGSSSKKRKQKTVQEFIMSLGSDSAQEHSGASWTKPHQIGSKGQEVTPAQQFAEFQRIQKNTRSLGSHVERRYVPTELISNPPGPEDVSLELLMASQAHMGHNTSLWNPANSRYIYGVRQGIHIISLETIAAHLRRAARVVEEVSYRGGVILFVGTRKGQMEIVTKAAELAGACHLFTKWTPGAITNRDVILKTQPTKVVDHLDSELDGFDMYKGMARPLLPDLVVCLNPLENYTMLYECGLKNIPTIGVIDTNVDPSWVTYTIPANDDSLRAMAVVAGVLGRAGQKGKERRLQDSSRGNVSWKTSPELERHVKKEVQVAVTKRKEVMGRIQSNVQGFTEEEQKLLRIRNNEVDLEVSEDEMVNILGETALKDAREAVVEAGHVHSSKTSSEKVGEGLADIEAQLQQVQQQTRHIELEVGSKPE
ncbi:37S ribosomal protein MRP4 precursor [Metarhizium acridum CQMa 102]|uniref:37S ribosomal protein MRP4 n=1 Tax=Metarhizium acridum (strain CQMa 102) TaxID=655827 RepID=E9E458_METAQ|nr:37S ribosomal protein MRP4 precursor [Metarhizium acridum CQMa 102]EFY89275.1 37S ribosomal protein MRP4 precursor [Metarhizium acridum CQMa 102]